MSKVPFMNEVITNVKDNVSLVILAQNQIKTSVDFLLEKLLHEQETIILVSFTSSAEDILTKYNNPNLFIIDAYSQKKIDSTNVISVNNSSNLTQIQIAIEKAKYKLEKKVIIIFDSLSVVAIYNTQKDLGKFIYLFSNKIKLIGDSAVYLTTIDTIEEEMLNLVKQFCDKNFDFSKIYVQEINSQ